jgi:hypothetical protein
MKLHKKLVAGLAVLAIGLVPAAAGAAGGPEYQPEHPSHGAKPPKGHGYGYYCKGESKKHVDGMQRTPFAECVRAAARANRNEKLNPQQACKAESKNHVKGQQGTPYSVCVKGVAQLREDKAEEEAQS